MKQQSILKFLRPKAKQAAELTEVRSEKRVPLSGSPTGIITQSLSASNKSEVLASTVQKSPQSPSYQCHIDISRFSSPSPEFIAVSPQSSEASLKQRDTPLASQYNYLRGFLEDGTVMFMQNGAFYELYQRDATFGGDGLQLKVVYKQYGMAVAGIPIIQSDFFVRRTLQLQKRVCLVDYFDEKDTQFNIYARRIVEMMSPGLVSNPLLLTSSHYGLAYIANENLVFVDLLMRTYTIFSFCDENALCQLLIKLYPAEILTSDYRFCQIGYLYCKCVNQHSEKYFKHCKSGIDYPYFDYLLNSYLKYMRVPELSQAELSEHQGIKRIMLQACTVHSLNLVDTEAFSLLSVIDLTKTKMGSQRLHSLLIEPYIDRALIISQQDYAKRFNNLGYYQLVKIQYKLAGITDMVYLICYLKTAKTVRNNHVNQFVKSLYNSIAFLYYLATENLLLSSSACDSLISYGNDIYKRFNEQFGLDYKSITLSRQNERYIRYEYEYRTLTNEFTAYLYSLKLTQYIPNPYFMKSTSGSESLTAFGFTALPNRVLVVGKYIIRSDSDFRRFVDEFQVKFINSTKTVYKFAIPPALRIKEDELLQYYQNLLLNELTAYFYEIDAAYIQCMQELVAELDVSLSAAIIPWKYQQITWSFPIVHPEAIKPHICFEKAYHPIMLTGFFSKKYMPQSFNLARETVLSGSNMSGKSTFLRLVGTLAILAQIGFPVPAEECQLSVFSNILSRIGGSSLSKINSTFYTECLETANLFNQVDYTTLLLIDELGRGTDQQAGDAIIQAAALFLMKKYAPSIIATHSQNVRILADITNIANINLQCDVGKTSLEFQYTVQNGGAQSLGIEVAQLAGMPPPIISRAKDLRELMLNREKAMLLHNIETMLRE